MRLTHISIVICILMVSIPLFGQASELTNLDHLVNTALEHNPNLNVIQHEISALEQKTIRAGAWKDPQLMVAYQNVPITSFALGEEGMSMVMIRLQQTIPFFGKTEEREGVVRKNVEAKGWEFKEMRNQLRTMVKSTYYRLALARQLKIITEEHVDLVKQLIDAVRIKYEVGRAPQQNLLRLEVLRDRLRDELKDFDRQDVELTATINATLHRDGATPISTPKMFNLIVRNVNEMELKNIALENRPALKQLSVTSRMHLAAASLAEFEAVPDPTFFASYGYREELSGGMGGEDVVSVGVGIPLPLFYDSLHLSKARESLENSKSIDSKREALIDAIDNGLINALATWDRISSKVSIYRKNLIPDAHRVLDATFSSYQVDRADFLSLYEAELELLNFEKTVRIATIEGLVAQATIELLIGRELQ